MGSVKRCADIVIYDFVACSGENLRERIYGGSTERKDWFVRTSWVSRPPEVLQVVTRNDGRSMENIPRDSGSWYLVSGIRTKKKALLPGKIVGTLGTS